MPVDDGESCASNFSYICSHTAYILKYFLKYTSFPHKVRILNLYRIQNAKKAPKSLYNTCISQYIYTPLVVCSTIYMSEWLSWCVFANEHLRKKLKREHNANKTIRESSKIFPHFLIIFFYYFFKCKSVIFIQWVVNQLISACESRCALGGLNPNDITWFFIDMDAQTSNILFIFNR